MKLAVPVVQLWKHILTLITYMKKLLDFDWLRAVQLKSNTSAKSIIPVQITNQNSRIRSSVHRCKRLECFQNFRKPPITFENFPRVSEVFRAFSKIFENLKNCWKIALKTFRHFPIFTKNSEDFGRLPTISGDFKKIQKCWKVVLSILRQCPKFPQDF